MKPTDAQGTLLKYSADLFLSAEVTTDTPGEAVRLVSSAVFPDASGRQPMRLESRGNGLTGTVTLVRHQILFSHRIHGERHVEGGLRYRVGVHALVEYEVPMEGDAVIFLLGTKLPFRDSPLPTPMELVATGPRGGEEVPVIVTRATVLACYPAEEGL